METPYGFTWKFRSLSIGWGKAVPIPKNPVFVPLEMQKLALPPPKSGMPFNAQLHENDIKRNYQVPNPFPRPPQPEAASETLAEDTTNLYKAQKDEYDEFMAVFARSKVIVTQPTDRELLDRIHKTIEYLLREGPVFEAIVIARESKNPAYSFLYDNHSPEHVYYRWKLYSLLHGDDPYDWRTEEFQMFEGGPFWTPCPLNPYAEGMPQELIDKAISDFENSITSKVVNTSGISTDKPFISRLKEEESQRVKGHLSPRQQETLNEMLSSLMPTKPQVGSAMLFCINHAEAANDVIESIYISLSSLDTPFQKKMARLFLVSDILHNCSAAVTNASFYRKGFQVKLLSIFEYLREYLVNIEDFYEADRFKQKILIVLGAWKEWTLYEDEFLIQLSNILLGLHQHDKSSFGARLKDFMVEKPESDTPATKMTSADLELDGASIDDAELASCLEAKGLSLRWYRALELSDNEDEIDGNFLGSNSRLDEESPTQANHQQVSKGVKQELPKPVRFKSSKWETVDPVEVIEQVVTMSKWNAMAQAEDQSPVSTTTGSSSQSRSPINANSPDESSESVRKKSKLMRNDSEEREK